MTDHVITLSRPVGPKGLDLIAAAGYPYWPPRLPAQPIFYPVTNEESAKEISIQWNVPASGVGFVTRFSGKKSFMDRYENHQVGGENHTEWRISAEDLDERNDNIMGLIEIIGEYK